MKTAALLILAVILFPALALVAIGARRDAWGLTTLGAVVFAAAVVTIRYFCL